MERTVGERATEAARTDAAADAMRERLPTALLLAGMGAGVLLAARPSGGRAIRGIMTVSALTLLGVAAHHPIAAALRHAGARRRGGELRLSFVIARPVEEVFAFFSDFENFPRFMRSLKEVRDNGDGRSHWCARTPSGGEVEWDAVTTKYVTNSVLGWRSVPRAPVTTTGVIRFKPDDAGTCVNVSISYAVARSGLADALAALVRRSTRRTLEREIRRVEGLLASSSKASDSLKGDG